MRREAVLNMRQYVRIRAESGSAGRSTLDLQDVSNSSPHVRGTLHHPDAGRAESRHLFRSGSRATGNDGAGVAHATPRGRRLPGDEADHWLLELRFDERRGLFFRRSTDFANHHDSVGFRIGREEFQGIVEERPDKLISANTDTRGVPT